MLVRNRQLKSSEPMGRWTDALDGECPCRLCYHPHDFGHSLNSGYKVQMVCLTRANEGCPNIILEPQHLFTKSARYCKRCGTIKPTVK